MRSGWRLLRRAQMATTATVNAGSSIAEGMAHLSVNGVHTKAVNGSQKQQLDVKPSRKEV